MFSKAEELNKALQIHGFMVSCAESCTGGLLAAELTAEPGSSAFFDRGFITYSNESKQEMLRVPKSVLDEEGAVSEAVAKYMADGVLLNSRADIGISITGIAGPDGGSDEKPVGTVCFGFSQKDNETVVVSKHFQGSRQEVREQARDFALGYWINELTN